MNTIVWTVVVFAWFTGGMALIARRCEPHSEETLPGQLNNDLPIFAGVSGLVFLVVVPFLLGRHYLVTAWIHHAAIFGLFAFLLTAQTLQVEGFLKLRRGAMPISIFATYNRLWWLTEIAPAPIAITILTSGLGLICQDAISDPARAALDNYSLRSGWLLALVASFGFFFWDGILGFSVSVREMRKFWYAAQRSDTPTSDLSLKFRDRWRDTQLLLHFVSFPFVFLLGALREPTHNFLAKYVVWGEDKLSFLPHGLPQAAVALAVWLSMGAVIATIRLSAKSRQWR